jgi:hypothetical protein
MLGCRTNKTRTGDPTMYPLHLDTLIPVLMGCAVLWLVARGLRWMAWLAAVAITIVVLLGVLQVQGKF